MYTHESFMDFLPLQTQPFLRCGFSEKSMQSTKGPKCSYDTLI